MVQQVQPMVAWLYGIEQNPMAGRIEGGVASRNKKCTVIYFLKLGPSCDPLIQFLTWQ